MKQRLSLSLGVARLVDLSAALSSPERTPALPAVTSAQYDNARTGANLLETALTAQAYASTNVRKLWTLPFTL